MCLHLFNGLVAVSVHLKEEIKVWMSSRHPKSLFDLKYVFVIMCTVGQVQSQQNCALEKENI